MWFFDPETGKEYITKTDQAVLNTYIVESIATYKALGMEMSRFAFLRVIQDYFDDKRNLFDLGELSFGLFSKLNEHDTIDNWVDSKFKSMLLLAANEAAYLQFKANNGDIQAKKSLDYFRSELKEYFEANKHYLQRNVASHIR